MKENSDGNDTNVGSIGNSIEENIEILEKFKNNEMQRDKLERDVRCGGWKIGDIYKCLELDNAIDNILSDYKRVLKENEILKEEKEQAWEEWNNLEQGSYGTEQKLKQQIKELRKENEKLKNKLSLKQFDVNIVYNDYLEKLDEYKRNTIPIQKVKDKIEEIQKVYNKLDKEVDEYINNDNKDLSKYYENKEKIGEMQTLSWCIDNLQELLEGRE